MHINKLKSGKVDISSCNSIQSYGHGYALEMIARKISKHQERGTIKFYTEREIIRNGGHLV